MRKIQLAPTATLFHADCRDALRAMADCSVDAVVTDPPYELNFMGKGWDNTGIANDTALWAEVFRVLKPGGHCAAFSASRTYHRMACAIEDAGFEIRDSLMWVYGTGFPKSQDVSKFIDKTDAAELRRERQLRFTAWMRETGLKSAQIDTLTDTNMGGHYTTAASQPAVATRDLFEILRPHFNCAVPNWVEQMVDERTVESENFKARAVIGEKTSGLSAGSGTTVGKFTDSRNERGLVDITAPATDAAQEWQGWGTALKPAFEPIVLARKPLSEGTVAANVLRWRTGALNIDACRVEAGADHAANCARTFKSGIWKKSGEGKDEITTEAAAGGRWPANVVHDGSDEVVGAFPSARSSGVFNAKDSGNKGERVTNFGGSGTPASMYADSGSAARFFYSAKASKQDRNGSKHPTVKPIALMEWLCTLITPPGGTILDPFGGSGTTAIAASNKGFPVILCEREAEYIADIRARFGPALPTPDALARFHAWNAKAAELQAFLDSRVRKLA